MESTSNYSLVRFVDMFQIGSRDERAGVQVRYGLVRFVDIFLIKS